MYLIASAPDPHTSVCVYIEAALDELLEYGEGFRKFVCGQVCEALQGFADRHGLKIKAADGPYNATRAPTDRLPDEFWDDIITEFVIDYTERNLRTLLVDYRAGKVAA